MELSAILILFSALCVLAFFLVVAFALFRIDPLLESIGGSGESYLARLRLGLRAIERETSHLSAAAPRINDGLNALAGGLTAIDTTLGHAYTALTAQKGTDHKPAAQL
jgi:hypothetical protein